MGQDLVFNHLMTENGLSQNSIFAIAQDSKGFMWYGSRFGLNRYDGYQFDLYKSKKDDTATLTDDYITALFSDREGVLWVGTVNGLNKFDPKSNSFIRIPLQKSSKVNSYIRQIYQDKKGNLWLATNHGLYRKSALTREFATVDNLLLPNYVKNGEILCINQDSNANFWIGTNQGLISFTLATAKIEELKTYRTSSNINSLSDNVITGIIEDNHHQIWVSTENAGLNLLNSKTETFTRYLYGEDNSKGLSHYAIRKMVKKSNGEIWMGTQEGLTILRPSNKTFRSFKHDTANEKSLNQNSIYSIYEDRSGSMWIGTYYGGVNVVYAYPTYFKTWTYRGIKDGIGHNVVSSILQDKKNNLWIGTEGGGLSYVDSKGQKIARYTYAANDQNSLGSDLVKIVYKDKESNIWVGTHGGGLNLLDIESGKFKRFWIETAQVSATRSEIVTLLEDQEGMFWVGSQTGLAVFNKKGKYISPAQLPRKLDVLKNKNIKVLYQDSQSQIWIATTTALYLYSKIPEKLQKFTPPRASNSVSENANYFNCIQEDGNGNVWIGLYYGGMAGYSLKNKDFFVTYTTQDGLPNNNVVGIILDLNKNLWISTSNGLSKYDPISKQFQNYTHADGLAADEFNYNSAFINKKGEVFFGGYKGLTFFLPSEIEKNNQHSPITFTKLLLFNTPVQIGGKDGILREDMPYTDKLIFTNGQNLFTIQFALLNYIKSDKNKYAYKLEGINNDWIMTTTPEASYTNLPAGNYQLLVKGANNDGVWSNTISMHITILPPFYKTWWAFCIYAVIIFFIIFLITRFFYLRTLLVKDEELHQKKLNFFTNVSHEIRTHITLVMIPIERLIESSRDNFVVHKQLNDIKGYATRLLNLVSELMDFRKAETDHLKLHIQKYDMIEFVTEIVEAFKALAGKNGIDFKFWHDTEHIHVYFDKLQLEKVLFNLISNAFKFTPAGGKIKVSIREKEDQVEITVEDTGRGISPEHINQLFNNFFQVDDYNIQNTGYGIGLALSKRIVELHKGFITVKSLPKEGQQMGLTVFSVRLPLGKAHLSNDIIMEKDPLLQWDQLKIYQYNEGHHTEHEIARLISYDLEERNAHCKVLLIEDNETLRNIVEEMLQERYVVLTAVNGKMGLELAFDQIPDLIISDIMMPEINGLDLCNALKRDERTRHIPVILLTAKSTEEDHIKGLVYGADAYVTKPFSEKMLLLNVQNLLHAQAAMREKFSKKFLLEPNEMLLESKDEQFLSKLIAMIEKNMEGEIFRVEVLAENMDMSYSVLNKKLKSLTNMSVNDFSKSIRLKRAAQLLKQKEYTVYEVAYQVGFVDRKYFSREFKKEFGQTPSEYAGS